jgi:hypothetical protein
MMKSLLVLILSCFSVNAFVPLHPTRAASLILQKASVSDADVEVMDSKISEAKAILVKAAETKQENSELVIQALVDLEQLQRQKAKMDPTVALDMKEKLTGDWRLIFTTGTANTQEKYGKINYFPLKAVQTFRTTTDPMRITNGIFAGDFPLVKFSGEMDFDLKKRKLEFDFDELLVLNFLKLSLGKGEAAKIGASSGLGSESNVENAKRGRQAFFNWISADDKIATARGGGGGLALWKRIDEGESS